MGPRNSDPRSGDPPADKNGKRNPALGLITSPKGVGFKQVTPLTEEMRALTQNHQVAVNLN
jgi:hypothetical protein